MCGLYVYPWKCRDLGGPFYAVDLGSVGCHAVAATAGCATVRAANKACNLQLTVCIVGLGVVFAYVIEQVGVPAFTGRAPILSHLEALGVYSRAASGSRRVVACGGVCRKAAGGFGRVLEGC